MLAAELNKFLCCGPTVSSFIANAVRCPLVRLRRSGMISRRKTIASMKTKIATIVSLPISNAE